MNKLILFNSVILPIVSIIGCGQFTKVEIPEISVEPRVITEPVNRDTDDSAIWIHPTDRSKSLIIGTDKHKNGALFAFDLKGKTVKVYEGLARPNNVDVVNGFPFNGMKVDIAVVTERLKQGIRVFKLLELEPIDMENLFVSVVIPTGLPCGLPFTKGRATVLFLFFCQWKIWP